MISLQPRLYIPYNTPYIHYIHYHSYDPLYIHYHPYDTPYIHYTLSPHHLVYMHPNGDYISLEQSYPHPPAKGSGGNTRTAYERIKNAIIYF